MLSIIWAQTPFYWELAGVELLGGVQLIPVYGSQHIICCAANKGT